MFCFALPLYISAGRLFPVSILYAKTPEPDYLDASLITVMQVHLSQPPGDVLLFLTGKEEIDTACEVRCGCVVCCLENVLGTDAVWWWWCCLV